MLEPMFTHLCFTRHTSVLVSSTVYLFPDQLISYSFPFVSLLPNLLSIILSTTRRLKAVVAVSSSDKDSDTTLCRICVNDFCILAFGWNQIRGGWELVKIAIDKKRSKIRLTSPKKGVYAQLLTCLNSNRLGTAPWNENVKSVLFIFFTS
jgi:hypothetical protein